MTDYEKFLEGKSQLDRMNGFEPTYLHPSFFDFQKALTIWAIQKGRSALYEDCGTGKSLQELVWGQNVRVHTNKPVLLLAPLGVSMQMVREADKFGIECKRSIDGKAQANITTTNYERLHMFNASDFGGVICDESSILKNFDGAIKDAVTQFMLKVPYRLLGTATAAPNDYIELGTSSEALGELGYMDMLSRFFKNAQNSLHPSTYLHRGMDFRNIYEGAKWRFRGHAEKDFWRWVCSWARALRKPSDLGFEDNGFKLPDLITHEHKVTTRTKADGMLFDLPAVGLKEQRDELRRTVNERCEMAAQLINSRKGASIAWCNLNQEGHLLEKLIPDSVEIEGEDSEDRKEEVLAGFVKGDIRVIVTKCKIAGFGMNFQHCAHMTYFPSHSYEQYYQLVRRCWRFGQKHPVTVDCIYTEGQIEVLTNLKRKALAAEKMFEQLVQLMSNELKIEKKKEFTKKEEVPSWLAKTK